MTSGAIEEQVRLSFDVHLVDGELVIVCCPVQNVHGLYMYVTFIRYRHSVSPDRPVLCPPYFSVHAVQGMPCNVRLNVRLEVELGRGFLY